MGFKETIAEIEAADVLLQRCYALICKMPEIENEEILYEMNQLELDLFRHFK